MCTEMLLVAGLLLASTTPSCDPRHLPQFDDFKAQREKLEHPQLDLKSHSIGPRFRTVLTRAVRSQQPNLAGHFLLVKWGCGTACSMMAIVNLRTGKIWHDAELILTRGIRTHADSILVIANPGGESFSAEVPTSYYVWRPDQLELLCRLQPKPEPAQKELRPSVERTAE
jgi:hypothetical protein